MTKIIKEIEEKICGGEELRSFIMSQYDGNVEDFLQFRSEDHYDSFDEIEEKFGLELFALNQIIRSYMEEE